MISVLNFKPYQKGSLIGFFSLRYHGLTIKSCKLMAGKDGGLWFAFPSIKVEKDGQESWQDFLFLTAAEREHVRRLIVAELEQQGHLQMLQQAKQQHQRPAAPGNGYRKPTGPARWQEDLSYFYTGGKQDDIPF